MPSLVKGAGFRVQSRRSSWVQIPSLASGCRVRIVRFSYMANYFRYFFGIFSLLRCVWAALFVISGIRKRAAIKNWLWTLCWQTLNLPGSREVVKNSILHDISKDQPEINRNRAERVRSSSMFMDGSPHAVGITWTMRMATGKIHLLPAPRERVPGESRNEDMQHEEHSNESLSGTQRSSDDARFFVRFGKPRSRFSRTAGREIAPRYENQSKSQGTFSL